MRCSRRLWNRRASRAILVGDSLGVVVQGKPDTLSVTMDDMLHHTKAVVRGSRRALVVADMPAYARFMMDTLLKHPSVQDCKTSFVMERVKSTTALPV